MTWTKRYKLKLVRCDAVLAGDDELHQCPWLYSEIEHSHILCNITKPNKIANTAIISTTSNCITSPKATKNAAIKRNSKQSRLWHSHGARTSGSQRCEDDGLHACAESGWKRSAKSSGFVARSHFQFSQKRSLKILKTRPLLKPRSSAQQASRSFDQTEAGWVVRDAAS